MVLTCLTLSPLKPHRSSHIIYLDVSGGVGEDRKPIKTSVLERGSWRGKKVKQTEKKTSVVGTKTINNYLCSLLFAASKSIVHADRGGHDQHNREHDVVSNTQSHGGRSTYNTVTVTDKSLRNYNAIASPTETHVENNSNCRSSVSFESVSFRTVGSIKLTCYYPIIIFTVPCMFFNEPTHAESRATTDSCRESIGFFIFFFLLPTIERIILL